MITKSYNRSAILRAAWSRARWVAEAVGRPVREIIGGAMRQCWALAKGLAAPVVAVEMIPQPVQMQQAQAGVPADTLSKAGAAKAEVERLDALLLVLREEKRAAYALLKECRRERIAAIAGEIDACPGVCWTNEERADAEDNEAADRLERCTADYWEALDYLSDEEREERRATLKERIAQGPSMVLQQVQQAQARDLRAGPPEPREIRVTALGHQGHPCDPESPEASLWIVTDDRLSRDCVSLKEALDLAEDFRGWGYVVPAN